jgi:peptidoglycan/LPS O-acetylase OafA/YrhL
MHASDALTTTVAEPGTRAKPDRFYRPELDVLRFIAFMAVFICHGQGLFLGGSFAAWAIRIGRVLSVYVQQLGALGVCLFFLLSSYLITELLLQEREKTGSVHLKAFYVRRILRIWPLYYAGVVIAIVAGLVGHMGRLSRTDILCLVFFVAWKGGDFHFNPMGPLWSISCEELFYAVWPTIAKIRGSRSVLTACLLVIPLSLASAVVTHNAWYNPVSLFLFFAFGGLVAMLLHARDFSLPIAGRLLLAALAIGCWASVMGGWLPLTGATGIIAGQLLLAAAYSLFFLSIYAFPTPWLPKSLIYLGRISYGLYVFHLLCIDIVRKFLLPHLRPGQQGLTAALVAYACSLALTIAFAAVSYRFFELPFLQLKRRFTFVRSRD